MVLLMASCSDNKNMEKMIPADATCVVSVKLPHLLDKARFADSTNGTVSIPQALQEVIKQNPDSPLGRVIADLPVSGLDFDDNVYLFMTDKTFRTVMLAGIDDEDKLSTLIEHRTGQKFSEQHDVKFLHYQDVTFAIDDDVLLVGREAHIVSDEQLAIAAASMLFKNAKSIREVDDIIKVIDGDDDINAYFDVKGFNSLIASIPGNTDVQSRFPFLSIFTDSDIKAFVCTMKLEDAGANITAKIQADEGSDFITLLNATLAKPDNGFLKAIPNTMKFVMELSVNGVQFAKLEQVKKTINLVNNLPSMGKLGLGDMIATFDGPLAIGVSPSYMMSDDGGSDFANDYNLAIVARSTNPDKVIDGIRHFADQMGQPDYVKDGRHVFNYQGKPVYVGKVDDYVYVARLDHELVEESLYELPDLRYRFAKSAFGLYAQPSVGKSMGFLSFGFTSKTEGDGMFYTADEKESPALVMLEILCSLQTPQHDEADYLEEY